MSPLPTAVVVPHTGGVTASRLATAQDLDALRAWRNAHVAAFYDSRPVDVQSQGAWFARLSADASRQLHVLHDDAGPVACVGCRVIAGSPEAPRRLELFNVIAGEPRVRGTGLMAAFYARLAGAWAAAGVETIVAEVRRDNPAALRWYLRQGFVEIEARPACHVLAHVLRAPA